MKNLLSKCISLLFVCLVIACNNQGDYIKLVVDCNPGIRDMSRTCEQMRKDFGSGCKTYRKGSKEYGELTEIFRLFRDDTIGINNIDADVYIEVYENGVLSNTICLENGGAAIVSKTNKYMINDSLVRYAYRLFCK